MKVKDGVCMGEKKKRKTGIYYISKTISENEWCFGIETVNQDHHDQAGGNAVSSSPFPEGGGLR